MPVAKDDPQAKPANEDVFQLARSQLPVPSDQAKYLKRLYAAANVDKVKPGAEFELAVVFEIADGHHINSHKPLGEFLVPTDVFHHRTEGLYIGRARFPRGRLESGVIPGEQLSVYRGRIVFLLPVEAEPGLSGSEVRISGVATYQACSDQTKVCYPPMAAEWELVLPVAEESETPLPAHAEVFAAARGEIPPEDTESAVPPGKDSGRSEEGTPGKDSGRSAEGALGKDSGRSEEGTPGKDSGRSRISDQQESSPAPRPAPLIRIPPTPESVR